MWHKWHDWRVILCLFTWDANSKQLDLTMNEVCYCCLIYTLIIVCVSIKTDKDGDKNLIVSSVLHASLSFHDWYNMSTLWLWKTWKTMSYNTRKYRQSLVDICSLFSLVLYIWHPPTSIYAWNQHYQPP